MINKPPPFKGLNVRIPTIIPIKGRGGYQSWVYIRISKLRKRGLFRGLYNPLRVGVRVLSLNSFKGGYMGDKIEDYYRGY